jgi:hypothetical protein
MEKLIFSKRVIADIEKCYSVCPIKIRGVEGFLVGTEKAGGCFFFNQKGELQEKIWDDPGGIMSLVPTHQREGEFLSTQEFYSPNDSKNARIVLATPLVEGWRIKTLAEVPYVHRFDILSGNDQKYLIVCTLKSDHNYRDDWTHPGKVYACVLPEDLSKLDAPLKFEMLVDNLTKNHGYYRVNEGKHSFAIISSDNGVLIVKPPQRKDSNWQIEKILDQASSDATLIDLDGDGKKELVTLSPFHGDTLNIFRKTNGEYRLDFHNPENIEFLHAIWSGLLHGQPTVILGHRKGKRDLFALTFNTADKTYQRQTIDEDGGPANVTVIEVNGKQVIVATNRETNQVMMYGIEN